MSKGWDFVCPPLCVSCCFGHHVYWQLKCLTTLSLCDGFYMGCCTVITAIKRLSQWGDGIPCPRNTATHSCHGDKCRKHGGNLPREGGYELRRLQEIWWRLWVKLALAQKWPWNLKYLSFVKVLDAGILYLKTRNCTSTGQVWALTGTVVHGLIWIYKSYTCPRPAG